MPATLFNLVLFFDTEELVGQTDHLRRDRQKRILYLVLSAGHIHDKINFCLLAEEFPFILLANCPLQRLSDVFFSKYLSTFSPNYPFLSKDLLLQ